MMDALNGFGNLLCTIVSSGLSLYKQLSQARNEFWAIALGVSPFLISILITILKKIIYALKS